MIQAARIAVRMGTFAVTTSLNGERKLDSWHLVTPPSVISGNATSCASEEEHCLICKRPVTRVGHSFRDKTEMVS